MTKEQLKELARQKRRMEIKGKNVTRDRAEYMRSWSIRKRKKCTKRTVKVEAKPAVPPEHYSRSREYRRAMRAWSKVRERSNASDWHELIGKIESRSIRAATACVFFWDQSSMIRGLRETLREYMDDFEKCSRASNASIKNALMSIGYPAMLAENRLYECEKGEQK